MGALIQSLLSVSDLEIITFVTPTNGHTEEQSDEESRILAMEGRDSSSAVGGFRMTRRMKCRSSIIRGGLLKDTSGEIHRREKPCTVEVIFFDFGGVLAEEGFREGLLAIARRNGLDSQAFLKKAVAVTFERGFVTGQIDEKTFWQILRDQTGINGSDEDLRNEVLSRFEVRHWMMEYVVNLKKSSVRTAILSDQTRWLEELNIRYGFFQWFDRIFNSYYIGKSKRDASIFDDVLAEMGVQSHQALLADDNLGNIERAKQKGLHTIHYQNKEDFEKEILTFCPFLKFGVWSLE